MNDQRSLKDQLDDLEKMARKAGLYDAHDWLIRVRREEQERIAELRLQIQRGGQKKGK